MGSLKQDGAPTGGETPPTEELRRSVVRFDRRRTRWRDERGRSIAAALVFVGLGWAVVVPALVGIFAGRWLDARLGSRLTFTAALGLLGLVGGCYSAWSRIKRHGRDEP